MSEPCPKAQLAVRLETGARAGPSTTNRDRGRTHLTFTHADPTQPAVGFDEPRGCACVLDEGSVLGNVKAHFYGRLGRHRGFLGHARPLVSGTGRRGGHPLPKGASSLSMAVRAPTIETLFKTGL